MTRVKRAFLVAWFWVTVDPAESLLVAFIVLAIAAAFVCAPEEPLP